MKTSILTAALVGLTCQALAQTPVDHDQHHPGGAPASQAQSTAPAQSQVPSSQSGMQMPMGQMMQNMPEPCRTMMQSMPQGCMGMMQQMIQRQGMQANPSQGTSAQASGQSEAAKAYMTAVDQMHAPMIQAIQNPDPDVAFVKSMIPHHQSAMDMAKVVLQYGTDEQTKKWAEDVLREQGREIGEMQAWLKTRGAE